MKTNTDIVREAISEYIKGMTEEKISQKKLKEIMQERLGDKVASPGILTGILSKYDSTGKLSIPIENVEVIREGGKIFYGYQKNYATNTLGNEFAMKLLEATQAFEDTLRTGVLSVSFVDLEQEERKLLYKYTEKLQEMKNLFYN